jgi:nitrogen fixation protein NifB
VELERPCDSVIAAASAKASAHLPLCTSLLARQTKSSSLPQKTPDPKKPKPSSLRPNAALVSSNGIDVDLHLGHATRFLIYGPRPDGLVCLLETRKAPESGSGDQRWLMAGEILKDCFVLLTASAGDKPRTILAEQGLPVMLSEDNIEGLVDVLYSDSKKKKNNPLRGPEKGEH